MIGYMWGVGVKGEGETKDNFHEHLGEWWYHSLSNTGGETSLEKEAGIFILRHLWKSK